MKERKKGRKREGKKGQNERKKEGKERKRDAILYVSVLASESIFSPCH